MKIYSSAPRSIWWYWTATIGVLGLTAVGLRSAETRVPDSLAQPLNSIPANIAGWTKASEEELSLKVLETLKPTSYLNRGYRSGKKGLGLFISYHAQQRAGESIHTPKHCLPGGGWEFSDVGSVYIPFRESQVKVNKYIVQNSGQHLLILYWYHSKFRVVANEYTAKLYLAHDSIFGRQTAGSIVRITLPNGPSALEDAVEFATALLPDVQACFGSLDANRTSFSR